MTITRTLCLTLLLSLPALAAHGTIITVERDVAPNVSVAGTSFAADPDQGRAWVVVDLAEHGGEEEQVYSQRFAVPGLSYDAATRSIHLQAGGRDLTCAVGKRVLWATYFRATSDCPIRVQQTPQAQADAGAPASYARFIIEVGATP